jgi:hypothetical protein
VAGLLSVLIALGSFLPASAAWSTVGTGSGAGAAAVMPSGTAPSGTGLGTTITITWATATFPDGNPVAGYLINRYNASTGAQATVGAGCAGVITNTTCTETAVPTGTWVYTDTPVQSSWTGGASPRSQPIGLGST